MAIESLDKRIDQLTPEALQEELALPAVEETPVDENAEAILPATEFEEFEPVAGVLSKLVRKQVRKAPIKTERRILRKDVDSGAVGPYQVINEEAPKANEILNNAPTTTPSGKPSVTATEKAAGVQETVFNLDQIQDVDGVRQFIEATSKVYGADKLVRISYKDVAEKAALEGYDERFIAKLIDPMAKTTADPREAYKMLLAITDAGKRAFDLGEQVKTAAASGNLSPDLASQFHQAVALEGVLLKAAKGRQADIARTLGIFSQARSSSATRGAQLEAIMNEAGGIRNSFELANSYTALDTRAARSGLAESTISGTLKDMWFGTYINGLLSSPVTHAKNIVGNAAFGALQIPERMIASGIGKARNFISPGGEAAVTTDELYAQAIGMLQGIREGGEISIKALIKNEPTEALSKIENARLGRDPFDVSFGDSETGLAFNSAMKYWGKFVTAPGRLLMAEDEFFKGVGYRMELNALTAREANNEYKRLIKSGLDDATASKQAAALHEKLLAEPTAELDEAAKSSARMVTFTRELEPTLQGVQRLLNNPFLKMFFPFVKTPTNIMMEAMSRTPGVNLISPRFWSDFDAGGIRRDMAMARVTLGSAMIYGAGTYALEGKLTGYGPMRAEDKAALEGTGWQQFSFVFNKEDVDDETLAKYKSITQVKEGSGKVYVSYAGIEPFSTLLSISATAGEYAMLDGGETEMEKIMTGGSLGLYQYTAEQPMLQGFGEIMKVFGSKSKDAPTFLYNVMAQVSKQTSTFVIGGSPAGAYSSFSGAVERIMRPEKSLVMEAVDPNDIGVISGAQKGFWEAMSTYCSRNPMCSDKLLPRLDPITGEAKRVGKGNWAEMFDPFKTSEGKYSPAHAALVEFGVPMPKIPKKMDGVELTDEQYNEWIEIATEKFKVEDQIVKLSERSEFKRLADKDLGAAQTLLSKVISDAYFGDENNPGAKYVLLRNNRELYDAIQDVKMMQREEGKYKR